MSGNGKHHFYPCPVRLGVGYLSLEFAWAVFFFLLTGIFAWRGQFLLTLGMLTVFLIYCSAVLFTTPEYSFTVLSRFGKVLPGVTLDGLSARLPGDRQHVIQRNPVNVVVPFERQLTNNRIAKGKLRVTMRPDPRIGDEQHKNRYASWVVAERLGLKEKGYADHHVQEAIEAPLKGLLYSMLGGLSSIQLDDSLHGLALFVESEISLHLPLHRDPAFRRKVAGCKDGDPDPVEPSPTKLLAWYTEHHRAIAERIRELDQEFEDDPKRPLDPSSVSHAESHTSTTFEEVAIVEFGYDSITTAAGQAKFAAAELEEPLGRATQMLIDKKVDPDTAAIIAAGMVGKADVKGNVVTGKQSTVAVVDDRGGK